MLVALPVVVVEIHFADFANSVAQQCWNRLVQSAILSSAAHEDAPNNFASTDDDDRAAQPIAY